jgi:hypothetical protein
VSRRHAAARTHVVASSKASAGKKHKTDDIDKLLGL